MSRFQAFSTCWIPVHVYKRVDFTLPNPLTHGNCSTYEPMHAKKCPNPAKTRTTHQCNDARAERSTRVI